MRTYEYQGRNQNGEKITGITQSENIDSAIQHLTEKNITIINIRATSSSGSFSLAWLNELSAPKVKAQEILNFARQMAVLIGAGVTIIKAVKQLARSAKSITLQKALVHVGEELEAGKNLASALANYPKIFSPIFISLIEVGENTGKFEDSFFQLEHYLEKSIANRKRLVTALRYPMMVIVSIMVVILVMNFFVVPKFSALFSRFNTTLPLPTRILMTTSNFMVNHWVLMIIGGISIFLGIYYLLKLPGIRLIWDEYKLKIPVFGSLVKQIVLSQFTWTFSMILKTGVPVLHGLTLAANVADNEHIANKIISMRDAIEHGADFYQAAQEINLFDSISLQMIEVGNETGQMDDMLAKVAQAYEEEIDYSLRNLTDLIEPILLIIIGGIVVILALAIYLPMWDLIKLFR